MSGEEHPLRTRGKAALEGLLTDGNGLFFDFDGDADLWIRFNQALHGFGIGGAYGQTVGQGRYNFQRKFRQNSHQRWH